MTAVENGEEKQSVRDLLSVTLSELTCSLTEWHGAFTRLSGRRGLHEPESDGGHAGCRERRDPECAAR